MRLVACWLIVAACGDNTPDKTAACFLGQAQSAATVQDRKVIGGAAPYAADLGLAARDGELRTSIAARRAAAWQVVAKVLAPSQLAEPALAQPFSLPAWHTWFARDDFERVFDKLYRDLGPADRHARASLDAAAIDAGFDWSTHALDALPDWPPQRYTDYVAAVDTQAKAQGLGGVNRVAYSTGAMRHLIASYDQQDLCRLAPAPDPYDADPMKPGVPVHAVEHTAVSTCEWRTLGPYQAGAGTPVIVSMTGDGDADLYVRRGAPPAVDAYDCRSNGDASIESCTVGGGGAIYVAVFGAQASAVEVDVAYATEDVAAPSCLDGPMPRDAVLVKADWDRVLGDPLPVFDTSGARMSQRVSSEAPAWDDDGTIDPDPSAIYTVELPIGSVFRLPALHVMTKELDHWLWITLWWSPHPDGDFGADRPANIAALPGPWRNYKMCVVSDYLEGDPDPRGGQPGSLGDALAAVHHGVGAPSWCSNPYLELGAGNAATNCIGCHQHGGTTLLPESILADQPHFGATRVRNNFFTDYTWAILGGRGEELSALVQAELDYWDANDPP